MNPTPAGALIADRFEVAGKPLVGGMGVVYLCLDHGSNGYPVALKTFKPEFLPDRVTRERFLREGSMWVTLGAHPHIVRCYLVLREGDGTEVYLVLELITKAQGRRDASLRFWLSPGRPLPPDQALLFALQVARGMRHATQTIPGLVHRDLKPENLLVGADHLINVDVNRLRITDFGLAAVLLAAGDHVPAAGGESAGESAPENGANLHRTQLTRGIVGTPLYMAPEQWRGEEVSAATDVYALGCILVEMLTGQLAVRGDSPAALGQAHCSGTALATANGLPAAQRELLQRFLALQPTDRLSDWARVEADLMQVYTQVCGRAAPAPEPLQVTARADRIVAGWSYNNIGIAYLDIGKVEVAQGYFERALQVGRAEQERELEGAALGNLGSAYKNLDDARRAVGTYEQALAIRREAGDRRGEGQDLGNLGLAYARLGDLRQAIDCHEQALAVQREVGDRRSEGATLGNLGSAYAALGDLQQAIRYQEQSLAIAREIGDRSAEGAALANLGGAYLALDDTQKAISNYEQALAIHRVIGDRSSEGVVLTNLGLAYADLGDLKQAVDDHQQALTIARETGSRHSEGIALGNLGMAYSKSGDAQQALRYYEQSLVIAREIGDTSSVAFRSYNMALLNQRQGDAAAALPLAQQAASAFTQIGHAEYAQRAQQLVEKLTPPQPMPTPDPATGKDKQRAYVDFQLACSLDQMRRVVARYPDMIDPSTLVAIEHVIASQTSPYQKTVLARRLAWLRQIAEGR